MEKNKKVNQTYIISLLVVFIVVVWGMVSPSSFETLANSALSVISTNFGWAYVLAMTSFVLFCIWIGFISKYKNMRLGDEDSRPEYSNTAWFAMLFSAGMGIGLVFWGVAEPLNYFVAPLGADPASPEAFSFAMKKSYLHWGLHPWANYAVLAMVLAYMQFKHKKPALVSTVFIPLLGDKVTKSWFGKTVDILAIFGTIGGIATSLGMGIYQINGGLAYIFNIPQTALVQIIIAVVITVIFIAAAVTGIDKGIKFISNLNVVIAAGLMIACFLIGPSVRILKVFVESVGVYLFTFFESAFEIGAYSESKWFGSWTLFYHAWWIAWAPFSATFIARISKGRTIKEFVIGVLLAPTIASIIWFSIFGTLGVNLGLDVAKDAIVNTSTALFVVLDYYPFSIIISSVAVVLLCTFFITSADASTFVLAMLSSDGALNPSKAKKVIWGILQSGLALVLMVGTDNGLQMLQTASIASAFPFILIMICAMVSLVKVLEKDFTMK